MPRSSTSQDVHERPVTLGLVILAVVVAATLGLVALPSAWAAIALVCIAAAAAAWAAIGRVELRRQDELVRIARALALEEASAPAIERAIRERLGSLSVLQVAIDGCDVPVLALDATGMVMLCNDAARELFETRTGPIAGVALVDLLPDQDIVGMCAEAGDGERVRRRVRLIVRGQTRWLEASAAPTGTARVAVVLTLQDVTELATAAQLKTDFAANAGHELRTPIASIRAAVETLGGPAAGDLEMSARLRRMIEDNAARIERMVLDLLDLSRLETPDRPPKQVDVSLPELAAKLDELFAPIAGERRMELEWDLDDELGAMRTDPDLLELSLRNLIDNALKFGRVDTAVRVEGRVLDEIDPKRRMAGARFRVIDQGVGIPLKHQQRIFERFYQVDEVRSGPTDRRGTGLGLAIVKHALRRVGGTIDVESVYQQGTTMTIEVPACVVVRLDQAAENGASTLDRPAEPR